MTVWGRLKGRRWASTLLCTLFLGVSVCVSGYSARYGDAYVLEERIPALNEGAAPARFAGAFVSDLCVVTDESELGADFATSEAAALFDISDRGVLYSKKTFGKLYPVNVTTTITLLVAIKEDDLNSRVHVTGDAATAESDATLYGIEPGDTLALEQPLYGLMPPSGNDAGAAIAAHIAENIDAFAGMMNEGALRLDTTGTHFVNPHGLNGPDRYATTYNLYPIFNKALKYPALHQVVGTTAYTTNCHNKNSEPMTKTWKGGNWFMIGERETSDGLKVFREKTGTIKAAGYCLIMASQDDSDKEYISAASKADSRPHLYDNMANIISEIIKQ